MPLLSSSRIKKLEDGISLSREKDFSGVRRNLRILRRLPTIDPPVTLGTALAL